MMFVLQNGMMHSQRQSWGLRVQQSLCGVLVQVLSDWGLTMRQAEPEFNSAISWQILGDLPLSYQKDKTVSIITTPQTSTDTVSLRCSIQTQQSQGEARGFEHPLSMHKTLGPSPAPIKHVHAHTHTQGWSHVDSYQCGWVANRMESKPTFLFEKTFF